jgi:ribosome-binding protein aMBF1 (putative translation factor)
MLRKFISYLSVSFLLISCSNSKLTTMSYKIPSLGEQIRQYRLYKGISQEDLAKAIQISQNSLSLIEDGLATPLHNKITAIEAFLEVELVRDAK